MNLHFVNATELRLNHDGLLQVLRSVLQINTLHQISRLHYTLLLFLENVRFNMRHHLLVPLIGKLRQLVERVHDRLLVFFRLIAVALDQIQRFLEVVVDDGLSIFGRTRYHPRAG